ncbi:MAG: hypothetical protein J6S41_05570, partial [Clostridia bacterium]|nr:hypothetical protein [Clostridia bacterium]
CVFMFLYPKEMTAAERRNAGCQNNLIKTTPHRLKTRLFCGEISVIDSTPNIPFDSPADVIGRPSTVFRKTAFGSHPFSLLPHICGDVAEKQRTFDEPRLYHLLYCIV